MCRQIFTNARIERHKLHTCTYFNMTSFCIAHSALLLLLFSSASLQSLHGITHTYKRCTALPASRLQLICSCISSKVLIEADCQHHQLLENNCTNNASKFDCADWADCLVTCMHDSLLVAMYITTERFWMHRLPELGRGWGGNFDQSQGE